MFEVCFSLMKQKNFKGVLFVLLVGNCKWLVM